MKFEVEISGNAAKIIEKNSEILGNTVEHSISFLLLEKLFSECHLLNSSDKRHQLSEPHYYGEIVVS